MKAKLLSCFLCLAYAPHLCSTAPSARFLAWLSRAPWSGAGVGDATQGRTWRWQAAKRGQAVKATLSHVSAWTQLSSHARSGGVGALADKQTPSWGGGEGKAMCCTWAACSGQALGHPWPSQSPPACHGQLRASRSGKTAATIPRLLYKAAWGKNVAVVRRGGCLFHFCLISASITPLLLTLSFENPILPVYLPSLLPWHMIWSS